VIKFQVTVREWLTSKEGIDKFIVPLETFLPSTGSRLRPVYKGVRTSFFIFWFTGRCQLFKILLSYLSSMRVENFLVSASYKSRNSSPGTSGANIRGFFILTKWFGNPRNYQLLQVRAASSSYSKPWTSARPWTPLYFISSQLCFRTGPPNP
jgi:hypothetical protein